MPHTLLRLCGPVELSASTSAARNTDSGEEDIQLVLQPLDGYQVEAAGTHAVALGTELDDALRQEGLAREIVHAVQGARKDAGLDISDRISLVDLRR